MTGHLKGKLLLPFVFGKAAGGHAIGQPCKQTDIPVDNQTNMSSIARLVINHFKLGFTIVIFIRELLFNSRHVVNEDDLKRVAKNKNI